MAERRSIYDAPPPDAGPKSWLDDRPHLPYLLPLLAFGLIMAPPMLGKTGGLDWEALWKTYHPLVYTAKTIVAAILLAVFWRYYTRIRWTHLGLGVIVGLVGVPLWIFAELAAQKIGISSAPLVSDLYNPDTQISDPAWRTVFLVIRVAGPTLVVPLMEELFYRDFLMRAFIAGVRFEDVEPGTFSRRDPRAWLSLFGTAAVFTVSHFQRPSAFLWGTMIGVLMIRTRSLGACIVAHGVTNLALYLYVIHTGDWQFM